jgi:hypothetical protein
MKRPAWADDDVCALADAMDRLLLDMGKSGQRVSLYAKAKARVAFEPFSVPDDYADEFVMTLADAEKIVKLAVSPVTSSRETTWSFPSVMIVCSICGNKRCPHAADHAYECTGSNEPGQIGSIRQKIES